MRYALAHLGIYGCYHMHDVFDNPRTDGPLWTRALRAKYLGEGSFTKEDWDILLGHCQAVADAPAAFFGVELAELYPDAKVVILNRDPEKWYTSVQNSIASKRTIFQHMALAFILAFNPDARAWLSFALNMFKLGLGYDHSTEKEKAMAWYKKTYDDFREKIPAERRIEFSVKDGWKPLCDFLELPVPMEKDPKTGELVEAPFPHLNDPGSFHNHTAVLQSRWMGKALQNAFALVGQATILGATSYGGYLLWKTRLGGRF